MQFACRKKKDPLSPIHVYSGKSWMDALIIVLKSISGRKERRHDRSMYIHTVDPFFRSRHRLAVYSTNVSRIIDRKTKVTQQ